MTTFNSICASLLVAWVAIDGDTIRVDGEAHRLMGFDAPESKRARCIGEMMLGEEAREVLQTILDRGGWDMVLINTGKRDRYGRHLSRLIVRGVDVADVMTRAGLARPYDGGRRESWCEGGGEVF